jgi:hypothetical protein
MNGLLASIARRRVLLVFMNISVVMVEFLPLVFREQARKRLTHEGFL